MSDELDPIESARQQLGVAPRPTKGREVLPAPAASPTTKHPMRPFVGGDGQAYLRRSDVTMAQWRDYINDPGIDLADEQYWLAVFTARLEHDPLLSPEKRREAGIAATSELSTDQYFAMRSTLFSDIANPGAPVKNEAGGTEGAATTPEESPPAT